MLIAVLRLLGHEVAMLKEPGNLFAFLVMVGIVAVSIWAVLR